nr:hypothetical protein StreXyl84_66040 [Streptomyces sp. Xyl84]
MVRRPLTVQGSDVRGRGLGASCCAEDPWTGVETGAYDARDVGRLTVLLSATVQGIPAFVTSRRITTSQGEALIDDAMRIFLAGASAER